MIIRVILVAYVGVYLYISTDGERNVKFLKWYSYYFHALIIINGYNL